MSPEYPLRVSQDSINAYRDYLGYQDRQKVRDSVRNRNWFLPFLITAGSVGLAVWLMGRGGAPIRGGALFGLSLLVAVATNVTYIATWFLCSLQFPPDNDPELRHSRNTKGAFLADDPDVRMASLMQGWSAYERRMAEAEDAEGGEAGA